MLCVWICSHMHIGYVLMIAACTKCSFESPVARFWTQNCCAAAVRGFVEVSIRAGSFSVAMEIDKLFGREAHGRTWRELHRRYKPFLKVFGSFFCMIFLVHLLTSSFRVPGDLLGVRGISIQQSQLAATYCSTWSYHFVNDRFQSWINHDESPIELFKGYCMRQVPQTWVPNTANNMLLAVLTSPQDLPGRFVQMSLIRLIRHSMEDHGAINRQQPNTEEKWQSK